MRISGPTESNGDSLSPVPAIELILLSLICLLGLSLISIGAWHTYPNAEELELSAGARDLGMIRFMLDLMITYDGRYSTNFMHAFNPLVINWVQGYKIMPVITTSLFILSLYYFLSTILYINNRLYLLLITILLTLLLISSVLSLPSTLYWMGGSFVYLYPCIFFLSFVAFLIKYIRRSSAGLVYFVAATLSLVIGIGFCEMFLPLYAILLSCLLIYYWLSDRQVFFDMLPIALTGYASLLFFVSSPGVSMRLGDSERQITPRIFYNDFLCLFTTLFDLVRKPAFFCSIAYLIFAFRSGHCRLRHPVSIRKYLLLFVSTLAICYIMCLVYFLPKSDAYGYPERIYAPILFLLITAAFIGAGSGLSWSRLKGYQYIIVLLLAIVFIDFTCGNNNIAELLSDFRSGKMTRFKEFFDNRLHQLSSAQHSKNTYKSVYLDKLDENDYPHTIYTYPDLETNRNESIWNKSHEEYFKINDIVVKGDTTQRFR